MVRGAIRSRAQTREASAPREEPRRNREVDRQERAPDQHRRSAPESDENRGEVKQRTPDVLPCDVLRFLHLSGADDSTPPSGVLPEKLENEGDREERAAVDDTGDVIVRRDEMLGKNGCRERHPGDAEEQQE